MEIDKRIEEIARFNPHIYASIHLWKISSMSEREFLIRLVLLLNEAYTDIFKECLNRETKRYTDAILLEEIRYKKKEK